MAKKISEKASRIEGEKPRISKALANDLSGGISENLIRVLEGSQYRTIDVRMKKQMVVDFSETIINLIQEKFEVNILSKYKCDKPDYHNCQRSFTLDCKLDDYQCKDPYDPPIIICNSGVTCANKDFTCVSFRCTGSFSFDDCVNNMRFGCSRDFRD